jgi:hypothetical protein
MGFDSKFFNLNIFGFKVSSFKVSGSLFTIHNSLSLILIHIISEAQAAAFTAFFAAVG